MNDHQRAACQFAAEQASTQAGHMMAAAGVRPQVLVFCVARASPGAPLEIFAGRCGTAGDEFPWDEWRQAAAEMGKGDEWSQAELGSVTKVKL